MAPSAISPTFLSSNGTMSTANGSTQTAGGPGYRGYDHITWYVGNAKQAAAYYTMRMGFWPVARRGLETGSRHVASHVISNGGATFVLSSPLRTSSDLGESISEEEKYLLDEMHNHLRQHGDAVKDVAFEVDDVRTVYNQAVAKGAIAVQAPKVLSDKDGEVVTAIIRTYGDTTHTLVERSRYHGTFLPGYQAVPAPNDALSKLLPPVPLEAIDHCVGNQGWGEMEAICE
jgi:4-hydroxyphenylpyruvate dioxygenase